MRRHSDRPHHPRAVMKAAAHAVAQPALGIALFGGALPAQPDAAQLRAALSVQAANRTVREMRQAMTALPIGSPR